MYLVKLKTPLFLFVLALSLFLISCEKYDDFDENYEKTENFIGLLFDDDYDDYDDVYDDVKNVCFDFVFPIAVDFPGGEVVSFGSQDSLWSSIYEWYRTASQADSLDPMIIFPIDVVLDTDETITVIEDSKLYYLLEDCEYKYDDDYDSHKYNDYDDYVEWLVEDLGECYDLVYPVRVKVGDDILAINSVTEVESVFTVIRDRIKNNENLYFDLVYPINVIDQETNASIAIDSLRQLVSLAITCELDDLCFSINYPITLININGTSKEIKNDAELIEAYIDFELSDVEGELIPVFPIDVTLDNGYVLTKNNLEDLEALYSSCD